MRTLSKNNPVCWLVVVLVCACDGLQNARHTHGPMAILSHSQTDGLTKSTVAVVYLELLGQNICDATEVCRTS